MHSKSRTSVLIIAAAITCVVLSFGLFSRGELLAAGAAGRGAPGSTCTTRTRMRV